MIRTVIHTNPFVKIFLSFALALLLSTSATVSAKPSWKDPSTDSPAGEPSGPGNGKGGKSKTTTPSPQLIISKLPASLSLTEGENASFSVFAEMSDGSIISYQWFFNGNPIVGATNHIHSINFVTLNDQGTYSVELRSSLGSKRYDASLSVKAIEPVSDMTIIQQPNTIQGKEGDLQTISIQVSSSKPVSYQWRKNDVNLAGQTGSSLTFTNLNLDDAGQYDVVLDDGISVLISQPTEVIVEPLLANTIALNWDMPTEREDGTYLSPDEISGYQIYMELAEATIQESLWVSSTQLSLELNDMPAGSYRFAIATIDSDGTQGKPSEWITLQIN